jgi:hypothetical protein
MKLHQNFLNINLDKCLFRDQQVSYLGFTLTPQGIKPGKAKLKAIKTSEAPNDAKSICSFMGLCNFFQNHIQNFAITAAPLFKAHPPVFRIHVRTITKISLQSFSNTPKTAR